MPIEVYTGKPGNGKTAFAMERLMAEGKKAERPIYAAGIDGLQPGLATVLPDVKRWNDIDPDGDPVCTCNDREPHAHVLPNGALCFVDEAWKWFGHLHDASRQATPPHVLALAEHRHRGIDFIWTTQGPNQLYPFARPLIADHYHCVRRFGTHMVDVFHWEELQEEVKSTAKRENAQRSTRTLPKEVFGSYKSADAHTIKAKIPLKVIALPLMLIAAVGLVYLAIQLLRPDAMAGNLTAQGAGSGLPGSASEASGTARGKAGEKEPETAAEYARRHLPRFATMPHTAPVFDDRSVTADPHVYCMTSEAGTTAAGYRQRTYTCLTEQGTRYDLGEAEARHMARHGPPYNPYKSRDSERRDSIVPQAAQGRAVAPRVPVAASMAAPQISGYGDLGVALSPGP